ncbi:TAF12 [Candida jiufengensis]|uniref:TAF12 n=1 Tax=Candida jiufengensis TaxID=497108 RepID=UPI0022255F6D|nr:TAF12 [Candida jiufengensis]KAI5954613.1 TAF12 [Candida jiufengensis]
MNNTMNGMQSQNTNGMTNQNGNTGTSNLQGGGIQQQQRPQQQPNIQNIPPQQLAQLVQAMKSDFETAKNATDDQVRQHHLTRAENIRRLLARYQAQKTRMQQQQQQQQQQQVPLQQIQQQYGQNTQSPKIQPHPPAQNQSHALSQQNLNNNNAINNFNQNHQGTPVMNHSAISSPALNSGNIPNATPLKTQQQQQQLQQNRPSLTKQQLEEQGKQKLQQQMRNDGSDLQNSSKQQNSQNTNQYSSLLRSMSSSTSSGAGSGTAGGINIPSNTISMERFNQIRQKLTEVQRKIQLLEQSKQAGNATQEQISIIDRELVEYRTKFQQFQKIGIYMRNQLVQQAKQQQQQQQQQLGKQSQNQTQAHSSPAMPNGQTPQVNQQKQFSPQLTQQQNQHQQQFQQQQQQQHNQMQQQQQQQQNHQQQQNQQQHQQQQHQQQIQQRQQQLQQQQLLAQHQRNIANGQQMVPNQIQAPDMNSVGIRQTPQNNSKPIPQGMTAQAPTPAFPTSQPTPAQTHTIMPSRQTSATPQASFPQQQPPPPQPPQPQVSRQGSASSDKKSVGLASNATNAGIPNGTKSGTPGVDRQIPPRSKSSMALNLAGITKSSVPSIPISSSVNIKPPTMVTFNSLTNTRPTLTGGAANSLSILLDTPAITKLPTFDLEGGKSTIDSGRILNKRKLQDIISTVGVDEGDGKTTIDGNVEEVLLDLADEFIYSVTSFACRLAKHRKVDSIDAKDIQLHLEKNWNIKIPGYAMDEIRSTRKFQPSVSYNQKVSGVEISKAVNGDI